MIHKLTRAAPGRLYGTCMLNPNHLDACLRTMDLAFGEWGFVQLGELVQYIHGYDMDCDASEAVVRRAVEFGVPVQVHVSTSNRCLDRSCNGVMHLTDFFGIVERVPEKQEYRIAHAIGTPTEPPVIDLYLDMIDKRYGAYPDNFWLEIRDFNSPGVAAAVSNGYRTHASSRARTGRRASDHRFSHTG